MASRVPFEKVLHFLQEHGWELATIWKPYRVFKKPGVALPLLIMVRDGMVDNEYVERARKVIEAEYRDQPE